MRTIPLVADRMCWNAATAEASAPKVEAPPRVFRRARLDDIPFLLLERLDVFVENVVPAS